MLATAGIDCFGEIFTGLAGCLELFLQSADLLAEGVLDSRWLASVLGPQGTGQAVSLLLDAADTASVLEVVLNLTSHS
ncbi:hypothetical protein ABT275_45515 [Streptomyces sp. NPDC001185]|uniref:hypothetical protein n=1 Tax=Streptomyces sp. NPDC001185 TaxID=3154380 RepID=UPI0033258B09